VASLYLIVLAEAVEGWNGVGLQLYGSVVCRSALRSAGMAVGGSRQLVGCSTHMAGIRLVQKHS
jgi:hypothetical protein